MGAVLVGAALCLATACDDYDDSALWEAVNGLEERVAALEQWQKETNNNIAALQELLTTNDMITAVTPVLMGEDTVGYTISFLNSDPITIYNGEKGEAGDMPQIGLTQDDAGDWYWTLNGELMRDADGNPIRANGEDGKDGQDGEDGEDGEDGATGPTGPQGKPGNNAPTPQIKLGKDVTGTIADDDTAVDDAWYLSVDGGKTWYRVSGKDGNDGSAGDDGDSFFTNPPKVDYDKGTVTFYIDGGSFEVPLHIDYIIENGGSSYSVYNADGLRVWADEVKNNASLNCTLAADIDLRGKEWTPIQGYTGTFDGGGKTITGLTINQPTETTDERNLGLFATITEGGTVKNLTLVDVEIHGQTIMGAVAGLNYGSIENCSVTGNVKSSISNYWYAGGIVGENRGDITGCTMSGSVERAGSYVGGIAGCNTKGSITDCHSSATVKGKAYVGGIAGQNDAMLGIASITACYSTGSVTATINNTTGYSYAGGVVGVNSNGAILIACYATGNVEGNSGYVGGVVGDNVVSSVTACYHATGNVTGATESTGGVAGRNYKDDYGSGILNACYWDGTVTGDTGIGYDMTGNSASEALKVSGRTTWTEAMGHMNSVLTSADTGWQYVIGSGDAPLVLTRQGE